jgi:hypothetical protein
MSSFTFEEWWEIGKKLGGKKITAQAAWEAALSANEDKIFEEGYNLGFKDAENN